MGVNTYYGTNNARKMHGCTYGERKTKESDFIPETRQKKPSRHSCIIAKIGNKP